MIDGLYSCLKVLLLYKNRFPLIFSRITKKKWPVLHPDDDHLQSSDELPPSDEVPLSDDPLQSSDDPSPSDEAPPSDRPDEPQSSEWKPSAPS